MLGHKHDLDDYLLSLGSITTAIKFTKNKLFIDSFINKLNESLCQDILKYEEIILFLINFELENDELFDEINLIFNSNVMEEINIDKKNILYLNIKKLLLDIYRMPGVLSYDYKLIAVSVFIFLSNFLDISININKMVNNFDKSEINNIIKIIICSTNNNLIH